MLKKCVQGLADHLEQSNWMSEGIQSENVRIKSRMSHNA